MAQRKDQKSEHVMKSARMTKKWVVEKKWPWGVADQSGSTQESCMTSHNKLGMIENSPGHPSNSVFSCCTTKSRWGCSQTSTFWSSKTANFQHEHAHRRLIPSFDSRLSADTFAECSKAVKRSHFRSPGQSMDIHLLVTCASIVLRKKGVEVAQIIIAGIPALWVSNSFLRHKNPISEMRHLHTACLKIKHVHSESTRQSRT